MNPNNEKHIDNLRTAMKYSRQQFVPFRNHRLNAIKQYVGKNYSNDGASASVPVNLLELAVNVYRRHLIGNIPRSMVRTQYPELKPQAYLLELALNHLYEEIQLYKTLSVTAVEGLFGMGIVKVGMGFDGEPGDEEIDGVFHDYGQPYADPVSEDDWVHDMSARRYEQVAFAGNRYRLPYDLVMDAKHIYTQNLGKLTPSSKRSSYDDLGEEKVAALSRGELPDDDEYRTYIELWDLWLPAENLVLTMPAEGGMPIRVVDYVGPECGPYHLLNFADVPDQIIGLSQSALWLPLHLLANKLFNKLGRQADRQKTLGFYRPAGALGADRVVNADDGDVLMSEDPAGVHEASFGGISQENLAFLIHIMDKFSWFSGNLEALGGLGAMSDTVGQDQMLTQNAGQRMQEMQDRMKKFTQGVMKSLAWYLWHDDKIEIPLVKRPEGTDLELPAMFSKDTMEGDFLDYNFQLDPYSMQFESPATRLNMIDRVMQNYIMPALPMLEAQGITVKWQGLMRTLSRYSNFTELEDILEFSAPPEVPNKPVGQQKPPAPATSHRTYERVNRPGATRSGKDQVMAQTLLGGKAQGSEMAALTRPAV